MRSITTLVLLSVSLAWVSEASPRMKSTDQCFPRNSFHLLDRIDQFNNIDEKLFNEITDRIIDQFKPLAQLHGAKLGVNKHWDDATVNAFASQDGTDWTVDMYGGLARRAEVTPDGYALVVCHELGHHFGGFSFYGDEEWAAAEGQSDYYATQACARAIWAKDTAENAKHRATVPAVAKAKCDAAWSKTEDQDLCYRAAEGGMSLASLLASLGGETAPLFEKPDPSVVTETSPYHPAAQCRLDTYFQGGLCTREFDLKTIPGKANKEGQTSVSAEKEAAKFSCFTSQGFALGARPSCWFKQNI